MIGVRGRFLGAALAAVLASGLGGVSVMASQPAIVARSASAAKPGRRGLFNDMIMPATSSHYGRKGAGISMAQQHRAGAKKRHIAINRKRHR